MAEKLIPLHPPSPRLWWTDGAMSLPVSDGGQGTTVERGKLTRPTTGSDGRAGAHACVGTVAGKDRRIRKRQRTAAVQNASAEGEVPLGPGHCIHLRQGYGGQTAQCPCHRNGRRSRDHRGTGQADTPYHRIGGPRRSARVWWDCGGEGQTHSKAAEDCRSPKRKRGRPGSSWPRTLHPPSPRLWWTDGAMSLPSERTAVKGPPWNGAS
jgi:hypothetical protein